MSGSKKKELGGATRKASVTDGARAKKAVAKKSTASCQKSAANKQAKEQDLMSPSGGFGEDGSLEITSGEVESEANYEAGLVELDIEKKRGQIKVGMSCKGCANAGKPLTEAGKKRLINRLLGLAETQATQGTFKITPADLIRLMQLHKEMNPQKDRKVTVQWIEDQKE